MKDRNINIYNRRFARICIHNSIFWICRVRCFGCGSNGALSGFVLGGIGGAIALIILSIILAVIMIFYMYAGFDGLNNGLGKAAVILLIIGIILEIVVVGAFIALIGYILLGIAFFLVGSKYNSGLVEAGGIIGIFIPFIGAILTYLGLGSILDKMSSGGYYGQGPVQYQPVQAYQVGTGTAKGNTASFNIYSSSSIPINSVIIEGTSIYASQVQPNFLAQGVNNINVIFPQQLAYPSGSTIRLMVYLANGSVIYVNVIIST
ncbi:DUF973 family protein [Acidianus sp. RZ1]|uniref:DUF973 family protein n=1 Tax=Acidianus sp. RZ1 TaxID=1540082 RepID=UPI0035302F3A